MSSGQREYDINTDLDRQKKDREMQQANIELIAHEILQIEPGSKEYKDLIFFREYKKQILSVEVFIKSIKHI